MSNIVKSEPSFTPEQIKLLKDTVAKGATDNEFALFAHIARTYNLDPLNKEIWLIKYGSGPATIFTSRDGYLKVANNHSDMDGLQSDAVCTNDVLVKKSDGSVEHTYGNPRGAVIGAYAMVYRKGRKVPVYVYASLSEYNNAQNPTWKKYTSAMIQKVAEAQALKRAFSISGMVTKEELDSEAGTEEVTHEVVESVKKEAVPFPFINESQKNELRTILSDPLLDRERTLFEKKFQGYYGIGEDTYQQWHKHLVALRELLTLLEDPELAEQKKKLHKAWDNFLELPTEDVIRMHQKAMSLLVVPAPVPLPQTPTIPEVLPVFESSEK